MVVVVVVVVDRVGGHTGVGHALVILTPPPPPPPPLQHGDLGVRPVGTTITADISGAGSHTAGAADGAAAGYEVFTHGVRAVNER